MGSAALFVALAGQQDSLQTGAIVVAAAFVLLGIAGLWLAWRMRLKKRQVEALRAQHQALLERQLAGLQALRAAATNPTEPHTPTHDHTPPATGG